MMDWEQIDKTHQRAKVFGGWLVKTFEGVSHISFDQGIRNGFEDGWDWRVAMAFVPDANHEWRLESKLSFEESSLLKPQTKFCTPSDVYE